MIVISRLGTSYLVSRSTINITTNQRGGHENISSGYRGDCINSELPLATVFHTSDLCRPSRPFPDYRGQLVFLLPATNKLKDFTMADEKLSRKMIFPYTFTSKVAQFPFKLHFNNHWMFPWFIGAAVMVSPVFYLIQKAANCEANVKIWAEKRRKEEEHHKHKWD